ncbi:hypothetical protein CUJ83_07505 [Methanocella sp. CWC-04]|uniref:SWIM-type domain-containing protein n=1 Tax=Methanooceanicella nereidis TaxID=2052831 RepID=A0AAP2RCF2_9EURY|nr:hypothetical protein [Methanocella sp. CWC-04]
MFEEIRDAGSLTDELAERVEKEYGARGKKAIEAFRSGKIKRYRDFFVVEGKKGEYIVEGDFCSCDDYLGRLSKKGGICYHSIATRIADATGRYEKVDEWYTDKLRGRTYFKIKK